MQADLQGALRLGLLLAWAGCKPAPASTPEPAPDPAPAPSPRPACSDPASGGPVPQVPTAFAAEGTHGIDVSHYNGVVPWKTFTQGGLDYVFVKATEGVEHTDPRFAEHWRAAKGCGLARGAYHFLHMDQDARAQAEHFVRALGADPGELPAVVDVERAGLEGNQDCKARVAHLRAFVEAAERALGRPLMIYSGRAFWDANMCGTTAFSDRPLWVARYAREPPERFGGWKQWSFWQYTANFREAGKAYDLDRASAAGERLVAGARP